MIAMHWRTILFHKNTCWILLGLLAMLLSKTLPPAFVEQFYSRGLFLGVRWVFGILGSWLPFAFVYPLFFALLGWLAFSVRQFYKNKKPWRCKLMKALFSLLAFAGGTVFLFQILWGFNYGREPLEKTLEVTPRPLTLSELKEELALATTDVLAIRSQLADAGEGVVPVSLLPEDLENVLRKNLVALLQHYGYPTPGKVRGRLLYPRGLLLRISTAGVYIPFTGEGHIDPGLHPLQLPFVMTHEMSHAYGFGDEGTCNFLAYLACSQSDDPFIKYVGYLYYWRYVAADYRDFVPEEEYKSFRETLPSGLKEDLEAIRRQMEKYPDIFPHFRDIAYNAYLQAQGIQEGMKNYDRVIMLVKAWRKREKVH